MLRYLTSGESHGSALIGIVEGIPAGLSLGATFINKELSRRQIGYGRGPRMKIEKDTVEILSGVRWGETLGSPIAVIIKNRDWDTWQNSLSPEVGCKGSIPPITVPRPGHADLSGAIKYAQKDIRNILERSSARETAVRVAIGAIAKRLIEEFNIRVLSHVIEIGGIKADLRNKGIEEIEKKAEESDIRCADKTASIKMRTKIDEARKKGDSVGGVFEVIVTGIPVGLGSHVHWDRKLDARIAAAVMSIQAIKGVEIGAGFWGARKFGSEMHDEIFYDSSRFTIHGSRFYRKTNNAGGIEGGITNGENIIIRAAMKPIPTLKNPLRSVDIITKNSIEATYERSDICAVPAAGVIGEAVVAFVIADAMVEKFGGDSISEMKRNYESYMEYLRRF